MFRIRVRTALNLVAVVTLLMLMIARIRDRDRAFSQRWAIYQTAVLEREVANASEHARRARKAQRLSAEYFRRAATETDPAHALFLSRRARELDREARKEAAQAEMPDPTP